MGCPATGVPVLAGPGVVLSRCCVRPRAPAADTAPCAAGGRCSPPGRRLPRGAGANFAGVGDPGGALCGIVATPCSAPCSGEPVTREPCLLRIDINLSHKENLHHNQVVRRRCPCPRRARRGFHRGAASGLARWRRTQPRPPRTAATRPPSDDCHAAPGPGLRPPGTQATHSAASRPCSARVAIVTPPISPVSISRGISRDALMGCLPAGGR